MSEVGQLDDVSGPSCSTSASTPARLKPEPEPQPEQSQQQQDHVNVFRVPHERMLELVNCNIRPVESGLQQQIASCSWDPESLERLLQDVYQAMWELKSHEYIENIFIMDRLKARLQARRIYNQLVCNCHEDSKLLQVIDLVEEVYSAQNPQERQAKAKELQSSIRAFLGEFLSHMQEEEAVFSPLLQQNFEQKELRDMNEVVLKQHSLYREKVRAEKRLKAVKRRREEPVFSEFQASLEDLRFRKTYCQEVKELLSGRTDKAEGSKRPKEDNNNQKKDAIIPVNTLEPLAKTSPSNACSTPVIPVARAAFSQTASINDLPGELLVHIFFQLASLSGDPRDLLRAAQVCRKWNVYAYNPKLWNCLPLSHWASGRWTFRPVTDEERESIGLSWFVAKQHVLEAPYPIVTSLDEKNDLAVDKEQDIFCGVIFYLLPRVGEGVKSLTLTGLSTIGNAQIKAMINQCPNLRSLDLSYTRVGDQAFYNLPGALRLLETISLEGCGEMDDTALKRLSSCFEGSLLRRDKSKAARVSTCNLKFLSLSGCSKVTATGLNYLLRHKLALEHLDLSGCYRINGPALNEFVSNCPGLEASKLYYCNDIEDGPWQTEANGCQNIECLERFCCQKLMN